MNTDNKFKSALDTSSKKFRCIDCHQMSLVLYVWLATGEYIDTSVGKCDRANKCSYHLTPREYAAKGGKLPESVESSSFKEVEEQPTNYIPEELFIKSLQGYERTNFAAYVDRMFPGVGLKALESYKVGRSKLDSGTRIIYWQIDTDGRIRTGKIMAYDELNGKRSKEISPIWAHNSLKDFNFYQCFFGEHLLNQFPDKKVAICESEKTAIISSMFFPKYVWLATGGSSGCKWREYRVFKVLQNRDITFFPDFGFFNLQSKKTCYNEWLDRANMIQERIKCQIKVDPILENILPENERSEGYDLIDFLLNEDKDVIHKENGIALTEEGYPVIWDIISEQEISLFGSIKDQPETIVTITNPTTIQHESAS